MKLPNIQYKQRAATAKIDPASYVRLGEAKASASESVGDVAQQYYKQDAVSEMQSAELNYNEQLDKAQIDQKTYIQNDETGKTEGAWVNGRKNFEKKERKLRDTTLENMSNPLGKRLFIERANKSLNSRRKANDTQLLGLKKEHDAATLQTVVDRGVASKNYEPAREAVAQAALVGTISEPKAQAWVKKIFYEEKYYNYGLDSDGIESSEDLINYRNKVWDSSLKEKDQNRLIAKADMQGIDINQKDMHSTIQNAEGSNGGTPAKGYAAGRKRLDKIMRTSAEKLGGDEGYKQRVYVANKVILDEYKVNIARQTVLTERENRKNQYKKGYIGASPNNNEVAYSDTFLVESMNYKPSNRAGYTNDYENPNPDIRTVNMEEFLSNKLGIADKYVGFAAKNGHQVKEIRTMLNTALTDKNGKRDVLAANITYKLYKENPFALYSDGKDDNMGMIATQIELAGGGDGSAEKAAAIMRKYNSIPKAERDALIGSKKDNDKYFDSNYKEVLEKLYPDSSFFSSAPATQRKYLLLARKAMNAQLAINGGDQAKALTATLMTMKTSWAVSNTSGKKELMQDSPEEVVVDGKHKGGGWMRAQGIAETKKTHPDLDTDTLRYESVEKFDRQDPVYMKIINIDGMDRNIGLIRLDRTVTPEYKAEEEQKAAEERAALRNEKDNKLREEWNLESPEYFRKRDHLRRATSGRGLDTGNPYGEDPSQLSVWGEIGMRQDKGMRAVTNAAKEANKTIAEARKKRLAEEKRAADARPRKRLYNRSAP